MAGHEPLQGSCHCGRNQYKIQIPDDVTDHAHIYFDSSRDNRRFHGTPLTAWLRVPLSWYQSHTESFFPDETHATIRRIFSPRHAPHTQRVFCGFCGTPLTLWSEVPREDADFMSVTIGSLSGEDQRALEDLGLLPESSSDEVSSEDEPEEEQLVATRAPQASASTIVEPSSEREDDFTRSVTHGTMGGIPWFEEMIEGSRLGRVMKARRGLGVSDDQSTRVEWEVSEWTSGDTGVQPGSGKRKRGHITEEIE